MSISFPGESLEYRAARDRLLEQEAELRRVTEAVAAARRELPPGGVVPQDYVFQQAGPRGPPTTGRGSAWTDIKRGVSLGGGARAPLPRLRAQGHQRGGRGLQLLSSAGPT